MRSSFYPQVRLTVERLQTSPLARCNASSQAGSHQRAQLASQCAIHPLAEATGLSGLFSVRFSLATLLTRATAEVIVGSATRKVNWSTQTDEARRGDDGKGCAVGSTMLLCAGQDAL